MARLRLTEKADKDIDKLPAGQGRHVGLHAEVPPGPDQPRPEVQAAQGPLSPVLGVSTDDHRALMLHVKDDEYMLVSVKHRSESYDNLERFTYQINQVTGGIDFYDMASLTGPPQAGRDCGAAASHSLATQNRS